MKYFFSIPIRPTNNFHKLLVALCVSLFILVGGVLPILVYVYISHKMEGYIYEASSDVPITSTALVLGTSKYLQSGKRNDFFHYRMDAAHDLFTSGRVSNILLSGEHRSNRYNEPQSMKISLTEKGVPNDAMLLDPAGFRTFDSVIRAKEILGEDQIIIISQKFHLERALFIARNKGMKAYGFVAYDSNDSFSNFHVKIREGYARVLTILDLYLLNTEPEVKVAPKKLSSLY